MMCIRGYSSDIPDAINLDEKLETASILPPGIGQSEKSFTSMCDIDSLLLLHLVLRYIVLYIHFWNNWFT